MIIEIENYWQKWRNSGYYITHIQVCEAYKEVLDAYVLLGEY